MARLGPLAMAALLLAGCAVAPVPGEPEAGPLQLQEGGFYAFHHPGGRLVLGVTPGGQAQVELFDPRDQRMGQLLLGGLEAEVPPIAIDRLPAGEFVLRVLSLQGNLTLDTAGTAPVPWPLRGHVERHILMQAPRALVPPPATEADERPISLRLLRAPIAVRLLADGEFQDLELKLAGSGGVVVEATGGNPIGLGPLLGSGQLRDMPVLFHAQNVRDGQLRGTLQVAGLQGALVLEAQSYSRAQPEHAPTQAWGGAMPFTYGALPAQPVALTLAPHATRLLLAGAGHVALFEADGTPLGVVTSTPAVQSFALGAADTGVPGDVGGTAGEGGARVLVLARLSGDVTVGADSAPDDFALRPLMVSEMAWPRQAAGQRGEYGQLAEPVEPVGILFDVTARRSEPAPGLPCRSAEMVRAVQGNETVGSWDSADQSWGSAGARLRGSGLSVLADGFGEQGCGRLVLVTRTFQPMAG